LPYKEICTVTVTGPIARTYALPDGSKTYLDFETAGDVLKLTVAPEVCRPALLVVGAYVVVTVKPVRYANGAIYFEAAEVEFKDKPVERVPAKSA